MSIRRRLVEDERGISFIIVVLLAGVLTLLSISMIDVVRGDSSRSADSVQQQASFAAAEAGINDYIAKLVDDPLYYTHWVHPGEATRRAPGGQLVSAGSAWTYGTTSTTSWTYPNGKNTWYPGISGNPLANGYEYDLEITPPSSSSSLIQVVSTGRKIGTTTSWRTIQVMLKPSSVTDFQMLADADISYGSSASTHGLVYAGIDSNNVAHSVTHNGTAYANIYAEGSVNGSPSLQNGAAQYSSSTTPSIRTQIKNPVSFSSFLTSLTDIQRAAQSGGVYLNDNTKAAWQLIFSSNGTFTAASCTQNGSNDVAAVQPTCGTATTYNVPSNGAIYSPQTVIVSTPTTASVVNGRVTVASGNNVDVAGNISYQQAGDDVLGLDATNYVYIAQWAPHDLTWYAATIAQNGAWRSFVCPNDGSGDHGTMTFYGSTATSQGGCMTMFLTRSYNYDSTLAYMQPPWFPVIGNAFTVTLFRELPGS